MTDTPHPELVALAHALCARANDVCLCAAGKSRPLCEAWSDNARIAFHYILSLPVTEEMEMAARQADWWSHNSDDEVTAQSAAQNIFEAMARAKLKELDLDQ